MESEFDKYPEGSVGNPSYRKRHHHHVTAEGETVTHTHADIWHESIGVEAVPDCTDTECEHADHEHDWNVCERGPAFPSSSIADFVAWSDSARHEWT